MSTTWDRVHNHPPYNPVCNERRTGLGALRGACLNDDGTPRTAEEPRYTLEEARAVIRREQCRGGHLDLTELGTGQGVVAIVCNHCGQKYVAQ